MKGQTLFLLGGSPLQADLLRNAKSRYYVTLIDGNSTCALRTEADDFVHLDFSDVDRLYELALARQPSLILTIASEPGNLAAALVSEKLGVKYNPADVVYATINKTRMKACLVQHGIPTARYIPVESAGNEIKLEEGFSFPLVVKPSQSSAGRGVKLATSHAALIPAVADAVSLSRDGHALIEEFIAGDQYSVETISCEGRHSVLGITREYFGELPFFAETQQMFPAHLDAPTKARIEQLVLRTLDAFGVRYGACHVELRSTSSGELFIIEIASRMGGWRSELIRKATGIQYADLLLQSYEFSRIVVERKFKKYSLVKMIFGQADLERERQLRSNPVYQTSSITWLKQLTGGSRTSLMDSAGYYFVAAERLEDALNAL